MTIKTRVHGGRLKVDEATNLPEGTEVVLFPIDVNDCVDDADRAALNKLLEESEADVKADRLIDAAEVLKGIRSR